jgi:hypothetical protein
MDLFMSFLSHSCSQFESLVSQQVLPNRRRASHDRLHIAANQRWWQIGHGDGQGQIPCMCR